MVNSPVSCSCFKLNIQTLSMKFFIVALAIAAASACEISEGSSLVSLLYPGIDSCWSIVGFCLMNSIFENPRHASDTADNQ